MGRKASGLGLAWIVGCTPGAGAQTSSDPTSGGPTSGSSSSAGSSSVGSTSDDSTSGDATSGDSTSGDATTGDSTSGDATTGDSTSGDATTGDSTTGDATTGDSTTGDSTTGDSTTGGDGPPPGNCAMDCPVGCEQTLLAPLQGQARLWHSDDARLALDPAGRAILWAPVNDVVIDTFDAVNDAALGPGTVAVRSADVVTLYTTDDATPLGTVDVTAASFGLARNAGYVWVADATSLRVYETNGALRWSLLGDFTNADVLALGTEVHAYAPASSGSVLHIDAALGTSASVAFSGTFDGWFYDAPRFWTLQADAFRLYEPDGTQIAFEIGDPQYGLGDRLVLDDAGQYDIVDIDAVDTPLLTLYGATIDGAAIIGGDFDDVLLARLDDAVLSPVAIVPPCCIDAFPTSDYGFAWSNDAWIISGPSGVVYDHQGDPLTPGEIVAMHGATAGRLAVSTSLDTTWLWDVDTACTLTSLGTFGRNSDPAEMSGDGSVLVSNERVSLGGGFSQIQVRLYDLPSGVLADSAMMGTSSSYPRGVRVSDDGTLLSSSYMSINAFVNTQVRAVPGWIPWLDGSWMIVPPISPDGTLAIRSDGTSNFGQTFEGASSYVYDADGLVDLFDGVTFGFVDDTTLLVGTYTSAGLCDGAGNCDDFVGADLTDLSGNLIAPSPIPDPTGFSRVSSTAVFLPDPPAIYDVLTGDVLWSGADGPAAPVGPDHVAHTVGGDVVLTKWQ